MVIVLYIEYLEIVDTQQRLDHEGQFLSNNITAIIDEQIARDAIALKVIANSSFADSPADLKILYDMAKNYHEVVGRHVVFADLSMRMIFNTRSPLGTALPPLPRPRGRSAVTTTLATGEIAVGDMFDGPVAQIPLVAMAVPVKRGKDTKSLLLTTIEVAQLKKRLMEKSIPAYWTVTLSDSTGQLMASRGKSGADNLNGTAFRHFTSSSTRTPWTVDVYMPATAYYLQSIKRSFLRIALLLVATAIAIWGGVRLSRRLIGAISSLTKPPTEIAQIQSISEIETVRRLLADTTSARDGHKIKEQLSERRFEHLADQAPVGIFRADSDGKVTLINSALERLSSLSEGQSLEDGWMDAVHPADRDRVASEFANGIKSGMPFGTIFRLRRSDGSIVWVVGRGRHETNADGKVIGVIGTVTDVTEIKQLEQSLQQSEERIRKLYECTPESISVSQFSSGRIMSVNNSFQAMTGYTQEELLWRTTEEIGLWKDPADRERYQAALSEHEIVRDLTAVLITKSGEERICRIAGTITQVDEEKLIISVIRDVTEREVAIMALASSEERFKFAMQGANDGLWDWNIVTNEVYYSPRWKSMLGYGEDEILPTYDEWERRVHPDDLSHALEKINRCLDSPGPSLETEFRMRHKNGDWVNILARGFVIRGESGMPVRFVGTHVDITNRKRREAMLHQSQKIQAIGEMTGGIAHDFNNLLGIIIGNLDMVDNKNFSNDKTLNSCKTALGAALRAADLVKQLLTFSRQQPLAPQLVKVAEVLTGLLKMLERIIPRNLKIKPSIADDLWPIMVDRSQFESALLNLSINARDAMPDGGVLDLMAENVQLNSDSIIAHELKPGDYVRLTISDTGEGIPVDIIDRIFDPFFTTKPIGKGTGLGLAVAYGFIKMSHGHITVESSTKNGTVFQIYLPRAFITEK